MTKAKETIIGFVSDIHLEFGVPVKLNYKGDVLILAGDISCDIFQIHDFIKEAHKSYKKVIMVAGNHEFYHGDYHTTLANLRQLNDKYDWFYFLQAPASHSLLLFTDKIAFIGTTLWSDMEADPLGKMLLQQRMNDFRQITYNGRRFTPTDATEIHREELKSIISSLQLVANKAPNLKRIVVTHHAPTFKSVPEHFKNDPINTGYATNLEHIFNNPWAPHYWIHGHMHTPVNIEIPDLNDPSITGSQILANPLGYPDQRPEYYLGDEQVEDLIFI